MRKNYKQRFVCVCAGAGVMTVEEKFYGATVFETISGKYFNGAQFEPGEITTGIDEYLDVHFSRCLPNLFFVKWRIAHIFVLLNKCEDLKQIFRLYPSFSVSDKLTTTFYNMKDNQIDNSRASGIEGNKKYVIWSWGYWKKHSNPGLTDNVWKLNTSLKNKSLIDLAQSMPDAGCATFLETLRKRRIRAERKLAQTQSNENRDSIALLKKLKSRARRGKRIAMQKKREETKRVALNMQKLLAEAEAEGETDVSYKFTVIVDRNGNFSEVLTENREYRGDGDVIMLSDSESDNEEDKIALTKGDSLLIPKIDLWGMDFVYEHSGLKISPMTMIITKNERVVIDKIEAVLTSNISFTKENIRVMVKKQKKLRIKYLIVKIFEDEYTERNVANMTRLSHVNRDATYYIPQKPRSHARSGGLWTKMKTEGMVITFRGGDQEGNLDSITKDYTKYLENEQRVHVYKKKLDYYKNQISIVMNIAMSPDKYQNHANAIIRELKRKGAPATNRINYLNTQFRNARAFIKTIANSLDVVIDEPTFYSQSFWSNIFYGRGSTSSHVSDLRRRLYIPALTENSRAINLPMFKRISTLHHISDEEINTFVQLMTNSIETDLVVHASTWVTMADRVYYLDKPKRTRMAARLARKYFSDDSAPLRFLINNVQKNELGKPRSGDDVGYHWNVMILRRVSENETEWGYFDSLGEDFSKKSLIFIKRSMNVIIGASSAWGKINDQPSRDLMFTHTIQTDGHNCGVFSCMFIAWKLFGMDKDMPMSNNMIQPLRRLMWSAFERHTDLKNRKIAPESMS